MQQELCPLFRHPKRQKSSPIALKPRQIDAEKIMVSNGFYKSFSNIWRFSNFAFPSISVRRIYPTRFQPTTSFIVHQNNVTIIIYNISKRNRQLRRPLTLRTSSGQSKIYRTWHMTRYKLASVTRVLRKELRNPYSY